MPVEGWWAAVSHDPKNWKKRPVLLELRTGRWLHNSPSCSVLRSIGGPPLSGTDVQFACDHVVAYIESLLSTKPPCPQAPAEKAATPIEPSPSPPLSKPPRRPLCPSPSPELVPLPKRARRLALHPPAPSAVLPADQPLPPFPVADVAQGVADRLAPEQRHEVAAAVGDLLKSVKKTQHTVSKMEEAWSRMAKATERAGRSCRCDELPDLQQALADARVQHAELLAANEELRRQVESERAARAKEEASHLYTRQLLASAIVHWPAPGSPGGGGGQPPTQCPGRGGGRTPASAGAGQ